MAKKDLEKFCFDVAFNYYKAQKPKNVLTTHLDIREITKIANKYAIENNGVTEEELKEYYKSKLQAVVNFYRSSFYKDNYLCDERKNDAEKLINKFVKSKEISVDGICIKEDIDIADFEEYANVVRFTNPDLYSKYKDKLNLKKENKKYSDEEIALQKYCYDLLQHNDWSTNKIYKNINMSVSDIRKNALMYATNTLGMTKDEFYYEKYITGKEGKKLNCSVDKKAFILFEELSDIDISDEEKVINTVSKYYKNYDNSDVIHIKSKIQTYVNSHRKDDQSLNDDIKDKINIYNEKYSKEIKSEASRKAALSYSDKRLEKRLPEVISFFEGYLNSTDTNFRYREKTKTTANEYDQLQKMLKRYIPDLYEKVIAKRENDTQRAIEEAKNIALLKIEDPTFDLFDYYHHTTFKMPIVKLQKETRGELLPDEMAALSDIGTDEDVLPIPPEKEKILKMDNEFPLENGVHHKVTEEEKQMTYDYITSNEFPFSQKLYMIALRRCANGRLLEYKDKNKNK